MPQKPCKEPRTDEEWTEVLTLATTLLELDSARQYGLLTGGPGINVERCEQIIQEATRRGYKINYLLKEKFIRELAGQNT